MPKTKVTPCTKSEIDALINASMEHEYYYLLFNVAKTTGRRLGEYWTVKVRDIDFERKVMRTQVLKRRRPTERDALLTDEIIRMIQLYIKRYALTLDDYIFRQKNSTEKYTGVQHAIRKYAKKAGINHNVCFHNFRHYFITELIRKGLSYNEITKLTGHSQVNTVQTYDHTIPEDVRKKATEMIKEL